MSNNLNLFVDPSLGLHALANSKEFHAPEAMKVEGKRPKVTGAEVEDWAERYGNELEIKVENNDTEAVKELLEMRGFDAEEIEKRFDGTSPFMVSILQYPIRKGNRELLRLMLDAGFDPLHEKRMNGSFTTNALIDTLNHGEQEMWAVIEMINPQYMDKLTVDQGRAIFAKMLRVGQWFLYRLFLSLNSNQVPMDRDSIRGYIVEGLGSEDTDVLNYVFDELMTKLHDLGDKIFLTDTLQRYVGTSSGSTATRYLNWLKAKGLDYRVKDDMFKFAATNANSEVIGVIRKKTSPQQQRNLIKWQDDGGRTAMFYAVDRKKHGMIADLLDMGMDINAYIWEDKRYTALSRAIVDGHWDIAEMLLKQGAGRRPDGSFDDTLYDLYEKKNVPPHIWGLMKQKADEAGYKIYGE